MAQPTPAQLAVTYYSAVSALTAKPATHETTAAVVPDSVIPPVLSPLVTYAPLLLFFALFVSAFGIQLINRIRDARRLVTAFAIAFFAASIPSVLSVMQQRTFVQTRAGPDEIPRNVRISVAPGQAEIRWQTGVANVGAVRVSRAPLDERQSTLYIADNGSSVTEHHVLVESLQTGMAYEFEVLSGTEWYDYNGVPLKFVLPAR